MKAIHWDVASQGTKFEYGEIPADLLERPKEARDFMVEAAAEASEELMDKYLNEGELSEAEIIDGLRAAHAEASRSSRSSAARAFKNKGVQAMLDGVIQLLPSPSDRPPVKGIDENDKEDSRKASRHRAVLGAGVQDHDRPVRGFADVLPRLLGHAQLRRPGLQPGQVEEGARRPHPADARQRARRNQGSARRRHRRGGRPEGRHHRRHAVRAGPHHHARAHDLPGARHLDGGRAEDQVRPGKDGHRPGPSGAGRSVVPRAHRRRIRPDHHRRHGRAAPGHPRRPHEARVQRGSQRRQAAGRLPRNHPQVDVKSEGKYVKQSGGKGQYGHVVDRAVADDRSRSRQRV